MARVPMIAEQAVRDYLEALIDPNKAVKWDLVEELEDKIAASEDPVERVLLRGELRRALEPDYGDLEEDFIGFASAWAEHNGVGGDDFLQEGVPITIIEQAGLAVTPEMLAALAEDDDADVIPIGDEPAPEDTAALEERVVAAMGSEPFTISDLVERTQVSRIGVRRVLEGLGERVEELEPDAESGERTQRRYQLRTTT